MMLQAHNHISDANNKRVTGRAVSEKIIIKEFVINYDIMSVPRTKPSEKERTRTCKGEKKHMFNIFCLPLHTSIEF